MALGARLACVRHCLTLAMTAYYMIWMPQLLWRIEARTARASKAGD